MNTLRDNSPTRSAITTSMPEETRTTDQSPYIATTSTISTALTALQLDKAGYTIGSQVNSNNRAALAVETPQSFVEKKHVSSRLPRLPAELLSKIAHMTLQEEQPWGLSVHQRNLRSTNSIFFAAWEKNHKGNLTGLFTHMMGDLGPASHRGFFPEKRHTEAMIEHGAAQGYFKDAQFLLHFPHEFETYYLMMQDRFSEHNPDFIRFPVGSEEDLRQKSEREKYCLSYPLAKALYQEKTEHLLHLLRVFPPVNKMVLYIPNSGLDPAALAKILTSLRRRQTNNLHLDISTARSMSRNEYNFFITDLPQVILSLAYAGLDVTQIDFNNFMQQSQQNPQALFTIAKEVARDTSATLTDDALEQKIRSLWPA